MQLYFDTLGLNFPSECISDECACLGAVCFFSMFRKTFPQRSSEKHGLFEPQGIHHFVTVVHPAT